MDIDPSIEREIIAGDKTIKENWATGGKNPLPFLTKFKFKHVGSIEKIKEVNITLSSVRLKPLGLSQEGTCDFCNITKLECEKNLNRIVPFLGNDLQAQRNLSFKVLPVESPILFALDSAPIDYDFYSNKSASVPFDTLICTFKPNINQPEYSASISAFFAYKYEFIKSQDFVIQPLPE